MSTKIPIEKTALDGFLTRRPRAVNDIKMTMTPDKDATHPDFPGDPSDQPPFGFFDSVRSGVLWPIGLVQLAWWSYFVRGAASLKVLKRVDFTLKWMSRAIPASLGIRIRVKGKEVIDPKKTYVYVANHVNIFDLFALYQSIPHYTRALEQADHFSWPFIGPLITAAGQIPVDPDDPRKTVKGLKMASKQLRRGESLTVLPEGSRTLDGSVGPFFAGAFRLAIKEGVPVVPMAIKGGRYVNRRGDWRLRPGTEEVLIGAPIPTKGLASKDAAELAERTRTKIIDLLHGRAIPGH